MSEVPHTVERSCVIRKHRLELVHTRVFPKYKYLLTHTRPNGSDKTWLFSQFDSAHRVYVSLLQDIKERM